MSSGGWRVLCIVNSLGAGGAERMVVTLANELAQRGHTLTILTAYRPGELADEVAPTVQVRPLNRPAGRLGLTGARAMLREIQAAQPEVCLGFLHAGNRQGLLLSRWAGVPCVLSSLQNTYATTSRQAARIDRWCFRCADVGVATSDSVRLFYQAQWRFDADKLRVIHNAVPIAQFQCRDADQRREVRAELGLAAADIACVTVANLNDQKGYPDLIEAAARVAGRHPRVRWFCAGQGHLQPRLTAAIAERGLTDRFHLLGPRGDVPRLLQGMDLFTLPSLWEGFGIATAEAMATGLPVVATAIEGTRELVVAGETGWLVPPADPVALATAWEEVWAQPAEAVRRGLAGRQRIADKFDIGRIATQFETLIGDILARRNRL